MSSRNLYAFSNSRTRTVNVIISPRVHGHCILGRTFVVIPVVRIQLPSLQEMVKVGKRKSALLYTTTIDSQEQNQRPSAGFEPFCHSTLSDLAAIVHVERYLARQSRATTPSTQRSPISS